VGFWGNPLTHGAFSVPILSAPFHPRYCPVRSRDRSAVTFDAQTIGAVHAQILTNVKQAVMICLFLTKYLHKAALLCAGRDHSLPVAITRISELSRSVCFSCCLDSASDKVWHIKFSSHSALLFLSHSSCTPSFIASLRITACFKSHGSTGTLCTD
jgi:hypothetical protein